MNSRLAAPRWIGLAGPPPAGPGRVQGHRECARRAHGLAETRSGVSGKVERWGDGADRRRRPVRLARPRRVLAGVWDVVVAGAADADDGDHQAALAATDEDVIAFVSARAGAVGYVSADAVLPDSVRAVAVQ